MVSFAVMDLRRLCPMTTFNLSLGELNIPFLLKWILSVLKEYLFPFYNVKRQQA